MNYTDEQLDEWAGFYAMPEPVDASDYEDGIRNCECTDTRTEVDPRDGSEWTVCNDCEYAWKAGVR